MTPEGNQRAIQLAGDPADFRRALALRLLTHKSLGAGNQALRHRGRHRGRHQALQVRHRLQQGWVGSEARLRRLGFFSLKAAVQISGQRHGVGSVERDALLRAR